MAVIVSMILLYSFEILWGWNFLLLCIYETALPSSSWTQKYPYRPANLWLCSCVKQIKNFPLEQIHRQIFVTNFPLDQKRSVELPVLWKGPWNCSTWKFFGSISFSQFPAEPKTIHRPAKVGSFVKRQRYAVLTE